MEFTKGMIRKIKIEDKELSKGLDGEHPLL